MFKTKKCKNCNSKIDQKSNFCPNCGNRILDNNEDWGMLGKDDFVKDIPSTEIRLPAGFNTLFNALTKSLDKEFRELDKELGKETRIREKPNNLIRSGGISISINSSPGKPPRIDVKSFGNMPEFKQKEKKIKKQTEKVELSEKNLKRLSQLPKEEPLTKIKRLSDRVIYEIDIPGVKSIGDISIIPLENSIEIKAIGKDKAYFKLIPLNYPIIDKKLSNGKLVLELDNKD